MNLTDKDSRWEEILPKVELGPNSRHIFELGSKGKEGTFSALMVRMIPDGGMVRVYPNPGADKTGQIPSFRSTYPS